MVPFSPLLPWHSVLAWQPFLPKTYIGSAQSPSHHTVRGRTSDRGTTVHFSECRHAPDARSSTFDRGGALACPVFVSLTERFGCGRHWFQRRHRGLSFPRGPSSGPLPGHLAADMRLQTVPTRHGASEQTESGATVQFWTKRTIVRHSLGTGAAACGWPWLGCH